MKYEDKFNRALQKAQPKVTNRNSGAIREVSVEFGFTHEGQKEEFTLMVQRSDPRMEVFGYGERRNEVSLWKAQSSHSRYGVDIPEFLCSSKLHEMNRLATQTESEVDGVVDDYVRAFNNFHLEFYGQ